MSGPWLVWQNLQRERNGALLGVLGLVRSKSIDNADIVRDAILQQLRSVSSTDLLYVGRVVKVLPLFPTKRIEES